MSVLRLPPRITRQPHKSLLRLLSTSNRFLSQVLLRLTNRLHLKIILHILLQLSQRLPLGDHLHRAVHEPGFGGGGRAATDLLSCAGKGLVNPDLPMKCLDPLDSIDAHHHFLLRKAILEELLQLDPWLALQYVRLNEKKRLIEHEVPN